MLMTINFKGELAVRLANARLFAATTDDIRRKLNERAEEELAGAGIELTEEQRKKLQVTKPHVRRAVAQLEMEGRCLRTSGTERRFGI
jgi:hypothetical protein